MDLELILRLLTMIQVSICVYYMLFSHKLFCEIPKCIWNLLSCWFASFSSPIGACVSNSNRQIFSTAARNHKTCVLFALAISSFFWKYSFQLECRFTLRKGLLKAKITIDHLSSWLNIRQRNGLPCKS